jgi:hypothetical protein
MNLYLGMPVLYRLRPGQARMGQQDLAAIVTRVNPDGRIDLIAFPPRTAIADALVVENVAQMTQDVTGHCWHVPGRDLADDVATLSAQVVDLGNMLDELTAPAKSSAKKPAKAA